MRKPPSSIARDIVYCGSAGASRICTVRRSAPTRPTKVPDPACDRHARDVVAVGLRGAERDLHPVGVAVEHVDQPGVGAAQPHGLREHGLEDGLELERAAPEHLEHPVGGGLALERLREVVLELGDPLARPSSVTSMSFHSPSILRAVCVTGVSGR